MVQAGAGHDAMGGVFVVDRRDQMPRRQLGREIDHGTFATANAVSSSERPSAMARWARAMTVSTPGTKRPFRPAPE